MYWIPKSSMYFVSVWVVFTKYHFSLIKLIIICKIHKKLSNSLKGGSVFDILTPKK